MDRRTAIVLVACIVLMLAAGMGLLLLMRRIDPDASEWEAPEDLAASYVREVEQRCVASYERPAPGGRGVAGGSAGHYVAALDLLPEIPETDWALIMDDALVESWNGDSPEPPSIVTEFEPATSSVVEGASRTDGRSPYAFCARDVSVEVHGDYRRLARAMELVGRSRVHAGHEKEAARIVASASQMALDMGRGGGIIGHAIATSLAAETMTTAVAPYAGVARDAEALRSLVADMARLEEAWIDLGDSMDVEGLVEETLYASCFMPDGWEPPVGPPVLSAEEQRSICSLGPGITGSMWEAARTRREEVREAFRDPSPAGRYESLLELEKDADSPLWLRVLRPQRLLADLARTYHSPRVLDDAEGRAMLVLARAMLALRLLQLQSGSLPPSMDETSWQGMEDGGRPLRDPFTGLRPSYTLRDGDTVILECPASMPDRPPAALVVRLLPPATPPG